MTGCLLFFLLLQLPVHSCPANAVALDSTAIGSSLICQNEEIYAGEFPCLPTTSNGTRTLVRFAVVLQNPTDCDYPFQPVTQPIRVLYNLTNSLSVVVRSGYFNVSCIRDTVCTGNQPILDPSRELYTACRTGGLSANCNSVLSHRTDCQWVDITTLSLADAYTLTLQLQPAPDGLGSGILDEAPIYLTLTPNTVLRRTSVTTPVLIAVILAFTVPFAAFYITSFVFICRRHRDVVIRYQYSTG